MTQTNQGFITSKLSNFFDYVLGIDTLSDKCRKSLMEAREEVTLEKLEAFVRTHILPHIDSPYEITKEWCEWYGMDIASLSKQQVHRIAQYLECFAAFFMHLAR